MQNWGCGLLRSVVRLPWNPFVSPVTVDPYDSLRFMNVVPEVFTQDDHLGGWGLGGQRAGKTTMPNPFERSG